MKEGGNITVLLLGDGTVGLIGRWISCAILFVDLRLLAMLTVS